METIATIVVNPAAAEGQNNLLIFLDDTLNIGPDGEVMSSFGPGDRIYFLIQVPDDGELTDVRCSNGSLSRIGEVTREQTDRLNIVEETKAVSLSRIPNGGLTPVWYGNEGAISLDGRELTVRGPLPAIVDMTYSYRAISYLMLAPEMELAADESYPLIITAYSPDEEAEDADNCAA